MRWKLAPIPKIHRVVEMPIGAHCDMIERVHVQRLASCLSIVLEKELPARCRPCILVDVY